MSPFRASRLVFLLGLLGLSGCAAWQSVQTPEGQAVLTTLEAVSEVLFWVTW